MLIFSFLLRTAYFFFSPTLGHFPCNFFSAWWHTPRLSLFSDPTLQLVSFSERQVSGSPVLVW